MSPGPIIACVDVQYKDTSASSAIVVFQGWDSNEVIFQNVVSVLDIAEYRPGEFYLRELPCLSKVLSTISCEIDFIIVDGYVWLDDNFKPGLGARLYESLERRVPVVGIGKTRFRGAPSVEVFRGESRQPLLVTAVGISGDQAAACVVTMHGPYRIPTMIRRVDQLARSLNFEGMSTPLQTR